MRLLASFGVVLVQRKKVTQGEAESRTKLSMENLIIVHKAAWSTFPTKYAHTTKAVIERARYKQVYDKKLLGSKYGFLLHGF